MLVVRWLSRCSKLAYMWGFSAQNPTWTQSWFSGSFNLGFVQNKPSCFDGCVSAQNCQIFMISLLRIRDGHRPCFSAVSLQLYQNQESRESFSSVSSSGIWFSLILLRVRPCSFFLLPANNADPSISRPGPYPKPSKGDVFLSSLLKTANKSVPSFQKKDELDAYVSLPVLSGFTKSFVRPRHGLSLLFFLDSDFIQTGRLCLSCSSPLSSGQHRLSQIPQPKHCLNVLSLSDLIKFVQALAMFFFLFSLVFKKKRRYLLVMFCPFSSF